MSSGQFQCVSSYSSGRDALAGIPSLNCAAVLMDICIPGMSGLECTLRLKGILPNLVVVIVTMRDDSQWMSEVSEGGR